MRAALCLLIRPMISRTACMAIRQQLAAADIAVELKELPAAAGPGSGGRRFA